MPSRRPGAKNGSPQHVERSRRGREREAAKRKKPLNVTLRDTRQALREGVVRADLAPLAIESREDVSQLLEECGATIGERGAVIDLGPVSAAKRILIELVGRLQVPIKALSIRFMQTNDPEIATRLSTLVSAQRQNLALLGLDRVARDVPDLRAYLQERSDLSKNVDAEADATARDDYTDDSENTHSQNVGFSKGDDAEVGGSNEVQHESGAETPQNAASAAIEVGNE